MDSSTSVRKRGKTDFRYGKTLGEGSFSTVVYAEEPATGHKLAVKILNKHHLVKHNKAKSATLERDVLNAAIRNPFVVKLFYTFQDADNLFFALEYCPNGDLLQHIELLGSFEFETIRFISAELLSGLAALHALGVIHRDLKPENILLDKNMHVRITDFGTAKIIPKTIENNEEQPISQTKSSFVGTAEYCSPELLTAKLTTKASDIWAIGAIIYHMIYGTPPFKAANDYLIFQKIIKLEFEYPNIETFNLTKNTTLNQKLFEYPYLKYLVEPIISNCLVLEPSNRPPCIDILRLPFFNSPIKYQRVLRDEEIANKQSEKVEEIILRPLPMDKLIGINSPKFLPGVNVNDSYYNKKLKVGGLDGLRGPPPLMFDTDLLIDKNDAF